MNNIILEHIINKKLYIKEVLDYSYNGLQVIGKTNIKNIITGVSISQELLNIAEKKNADAIIVHHGLFWNKELPIIKGIKRNRLKKLLDNNINLYAWHLPLDIHPTLGNNITLAKYLNIQVSEYSGSIVLYGSFSIPINNIVLKSKIENTLKTSVLHFNKNAPVSIKNIALCTGSGQKFFEKAADKGIDAFISGEANESTMHMAYEMGINFYSAGHYSTEKGGIFSLGEWIKKEYNLLVTFIDIPNPI